jgi:peptidyl-tRNA hydrolase
MPVYDIKQYILINKSLKIGRGKAISQGAHASLAVFFDVMRYQRGVMGGGEDIDFDDLPAAVDEKRDIKTISRPEWKKHIWECVMTEDMHEWKLGAFAKITLAADFESIDKLTTIASELEVPFSVIHDNGVTQVEPGSLTAAAIGPFNTTKTEYATLVAGLKELKLLS